MYELGDARRSRCHYHEKAQTVPRVEAPERREPVSVASARSDVLVSARNVSKTFHVGGIPVRGLAGVDLDVRAGETVGLVGESGSGKTTLARVLLGLTEPDEDSVVELGGEALAGLTTKRTSEAKKALQIVFQNPDSALNRRHTVRRMLKRTLSKLAGVGGNAADLRAQELVDAVRLPERALSARPTGLSGGQKQRVAIARAFAGEPTVVLCDEPTSALDVSVQASILNLLVDLQVNQGVAYLFVSHDLAVVQYMSDRIVVMYLGQVMEVGPAARVVDGPHHPYTEVLLSAVPTMDGRPAQRVHLRGDPPDSRHPPTGCPFQNRCPRKIGAICEEELPALRVLDEGHSVRCHLPEGELPRAGAAAPARPQVAPPRSARLAKQER